MEKKRLLAPTESNGEMKLFSYYFNTDIDDLCGHYFLRRLHKYSDFFLNLGRKPKMNLIRAMYIKCLQKVVVDVYLDTEEKQNITEEQAEILIEMAECYLNQVKLFEDRSMPTQREGCSFVLFWVTVVLLNSDNKNLPMSSF